MNKKRVKVIKFLVIAVFLAVLIKLFYVQIIQREKFIKLLEKQYYTTEKVIYPRGTIYDSKGNILAISVPTITIYAIPKYIKNKRRLAKELSSVIKQSQQVILNKLNQNKKYTVIASNLDKSLKEKLEEIRFKTKEWNFGILETSKRVYPFKKIGANNIGFVNKYTGEGKEGIEYKYNDILGGGFGKILLMKDARGYPITVVSEKKKEKKDIVLTIDSNIQFMAEEALKKLVKERKPKEAVVLIMDPKTGEILANAVYPSYDPNRYWKYRIFSNPTFRGAYEVGSITKPFIMARALSKGLVKKNELIYGGNGKVVVDGITIRDHSKFKYLTPEEVIIHSSNVGIIRVALRFKPKDFFSLLESLGFGQSTHTFPGESSGLLKESLRPIDIAYASIGQSWTATPIQVARAYAAIANGGYLVKPHFLREIKNADRTETVSYSYDTSKKVLSDKEIKWLKHVLKLVVEKGTARKGKSKFYTIAGKTGTAEKYDPKLKALSKSKFYTWFAGFFPVENPKYVIVVFANEPKKIRKWEIIGGGSVSSTVLKELIDRLMFYSKVKPDKSK